MVPGADVLNLIFYCAQQLGVALGVGAETIMLVAYLQAARDGVIDAKEAQFMRATRGVLFTALALIIVSGFGITALHVLAAQSATIFTPAYLFKWLLILVVLLLTAFRKLVPQKYDEALLGGSWYALFVVHILAPVTTWTNLLEWWAIWMVGFALCWTALTLIIRDKKPKTTEEKPAPIPKPPPIVIVKKEEPVQPAPKEVTKEEPKIILDPPQKIIPVAAPSTVAPPQVTIPQMAKIKPEPLPNIIQPIIPSPAAKVTDKPFLPQVPPLQPIPTMPLAPVPPAPVAAPAPAAPTATLPAVGAVPPAGPKPELKGLTIMPKAPGDIK